MATIFISGSRVIPFLPKEAKSRLDRIIQEGHDIVIGDSDKGVDAMIAAYFADNSYDRISIYTTRPVPRLKTILPSWKTVTVNPEIDKKVDKRGNVVNQRDIETKKDMAMGDVADFGFVIWKPEYPNRFGKASVSKGSLRNMVQLLSDSKPVVLYRLDELDDTFSLIELRNKQELNSLIENESPLVQRSYASILDNSNEDNQERLF